MKFPLMVFGLVVFALMGCVPLESMPQDGAAPGAVATGAVAQGAAAEGAVTETSSEALAEALQEYLTLAEAQGFSGSVFVGLEGETLLAEGYGMANRAEGIPNTKETLYDIGSITKMFTAIAILQLESAGKLSVDDPITNYFDNVPGDKAEITLDQILFHNAGLIDFVAGDDFTPITKEETIEETLSAPLLFAPGEDWSYSNAGYSLLAAIIEQVSGQSYVEYMHTHIFEPAGMTDTGFYGDTRWDAAQVAHGYLHGRDMDSPLHWPGPYWGILGNGGIVTTVVDMARWDEALRTGALLDEAATEKLFTPRMTMDESEELTFYEVYGGGLLVRGDGSRISASTGGNDYGFLADYLRYMDDDITVITLTNDESLNGAFLARELVRILRGETPADPANLPAPTIE